MERSPVTEKTLGIPMQEGYSNQHFSEVRHKAEREYLTKVKSKKKVKTIKLPIKPGEKVIVGRGYGDAEYCLVEIVDFEEYLNRYNYYGIVLKTTSQKMIDRIGRLIKIGDLLFSWGIINIPSDSKMNWIEKGE